MDEQLGELVKEKGNEDCHSLSRECLETIGMCSIYCTHAQSRVEGIQVSHQEEGVESVEEDEHEQFQH